MQVPHSISSQGMAVANLPWVDSPAQVQRREPLMHPHAGCCASVGTMCLAKGRGRAQQAVPLCTNLPGLHCPILQPPASLMFECNSK